MKDHISEMLVVTDRLSLDEALTKNLILALLLEILPESYDTLVTVLESRPESELPKELAKEKLSQEHKGSYAIHFVLKDFYLCKEYFHSKVQFYVHPRDYNPGLQLADVNFSTPLPLGTNVLTKVQAVADMQMIGRDIWIPLFTVEDDLCRILYMYLGQLMYDLQRDFGILPKSCPVPRGTFHAVNHTFNYRTLKLQTFPFGKINITISGLEKATKEKLWCFILAVWNQPKED
ncbi:hypothetical protein ILUMI_16556 [Ignelater luminosus]|uniref:Uncharacterized protein n=1 Tax=Ignelater luminosus TaxID=2038154 RepID=A0A8K0G5V3_IGNLU|nr:hypothetical protein ILUMI_16556 [Ignelater luminosus]